MSNVTARPVGAALLGLLPLLVPGASAQTTETLAVFTVEPGATRTNALVSASLEGLTLQPQNGALQIVELIGDERIPRPAQLESGANPRIWWVLDGTTTTPRSFELRTGTPTQGVASAGAVAAEDDGESLTLRVRGKDVLRYQYGMLAPPAGASRLYGRSGFIHPLWSPAGAVLTRIQPPDHYHHVGIWNPWTHTEFEGREIDFWNLHGGTGTVRFKAFISKVVGDVYAGFRAVHEHVDLNAPDPSGAKVALNEEWDVRAWNVGPDAKVWVIDFVSTLSPATASPLTIQKYRYQGFGFRAVAEWNDENSRLLTSEGKDKSDGNATRARWCDVRGPTAAGTSGILFMTHPGNFDYPERLRIWPTGQNDGVENVFFNFNPTQDRDWMLEPGNAYTLRYRMLVYDGELTSEQAEAHWYDFAHPPHATKLRSEK
jgi:hypothetical protein